MAVGGLGAFYTSGESTVKNLITKLPRWSIFGIYFTALILYLFRQVIFNSYFISPFSRLVISLVFLLIILEQNFAGNSIFKMGNNKTISKLGQYTYGFYCLHFIGILIAETLLRRLGMGNRLWQVLFLEGTLSLGITVCMGYLSYTLYESKFLKLKERFQIITKK